MVHCGRRGTEAICGTLSHTFLYEQGELKLFRFMVVN